MGSIGEWPRRDQPGGSTRPGYTLKCLDEMVEPESYRLSLRSRTAILRSPLDDPARAAYVSEVWARLTVVSEN